LTSEALANPIVCDDLGFLFNKEALIQKLLERTLQQIPTFAHIRSLKVCVLV
jgi:hypothetical protein